MKDRTYIGDLGKHIGKDVVIVGWVNVRRDHGKLIFVDLRDETGIIQTVTTPAAGAAYKTIDKARAEWVLGLSGLVKERPEEMKTDAPNGKIELEVKEVQVLNEAKTPPFEITADTKNIDEEVRLKYRYLDLRTARMQKIIRLRSEFVRRARDFLFSRAFTEIETPLLTKSTPEGSRDFVVPSRLHPGKFYALPQAPQQYKQLLVTAGFEKYFQIARAIRDEDLRADRGFEHTQIDLEMAFAEQSDVMDTVEAMMTQVAESLGYTIKEKPFPRIPHKEAMEKFGADKFDLRSEEEEKQEVLAFAWVYQFPFFEKIDDGKFTFTHNPFSMPIPKHLDWHLKGEKVGEIMTTQYDLVCNGFEVGGGSIRANKPEILEATYKIMGYTDEQIKKSIGHMLEAFQYGAPPHGGIALGVDRIIMTLTGEDGLKETQAFPMTRRGQTAVMEAPAELPKEQLNELGIEIKKKPGK